MLDTFINLEFCFYLKFQETLTCKTFGSFLKKALLFPNCPKWFIDSHFLQRKTVMCQIRNVYS